MSLSNVVAYLAGYLLITFGQAMLVETITRHRRRVSIPKVILAYVASYLFQAAVYFFMPAVIPDAISIYVNMCCTMLPTVAISVFLYRGTLLTCIFAGASTMIGALGESIAIYAICLVAGVTTNDVLGDPNLLTLGLFLSGVITTLILLLAALICRQFQKNSGYLSNSYLMATMLTITSSLVVTYNIIYTLMNEQPLNETMAFLIAVALVAINFFVLFLYRRMVADTENRYRNLFADTPSGVCVLSPDDQLSIVLANKIFYRIMGVKPKKPQTKRAESFFALLNEDARAQVEQQWGEMQRSDETHFEHEIPVTWQRTQHFGVDLLRSPWQRKSHRQCA